MSDLDDMRLEQPSLALRSAWNQARDTGGHLATATRMTSKMRQEHENLLQDALTHQVLKALGETYWDACGIEDARQIVGDRHGHRDGPMKQRSPPAELRMYHCVHWVEITAKKRAALISIYLDYMNVDDERGPLVFGARGWDAILTACDLIVSPPTTIAATEEFSRRSSYAHPSIRRRLDNLRKTAANVAL